MRLKVLLAILLASPACAVSSSPVSPSSGTWRFTGTISAIEGSRVGGPIHGAELMVVKGVNANARVMSDETGHYEFSGLESGRFTVTISAPGFVSATPVVDLFRDTEVNFALARQ